MSEPLAVYLNDHLAGSIAGLNMMDALTGHTEGSPLAARLRALAEEVREDQQLVRDVLDRIEAGERHLTQAAAWVTQKVSEGRIALTGRAHPGLALLEALESLALGLQGKLALFRVLAILAQSDHRLAGLPFTARATRTAAQHAMIEAERLAAAREAFGSAAAERV
jgi:hypothetical protein